MRSGPVITIDGPAASGKTTAARKLSRRLGLVHLDSGALYRAVTLLALEKKVDLSDSQAAVRLLEKTPPRLVYADQGTRVLLGDRDVTDDIRKSSVTASVRYIAESSAVRGALMPIQRKLACTGAVAEGRDMGTVVFPNAGCKFYLDAQLTERTSRRFLELQARGQELPYDRVLTGLRERDRRDRSRRVAPLKQAADAIYLDSSHLSVEQVVDELYQLCHDKLKLEARQ